MQRRRGKREQERRAKHDVARIIALASQGYSAAVIASSVNLPVRTVLEVLERVRA